MPFESFLDFANLLPEALLLVTDDGTVLAANPSARLALQLDPKPLDQPRLSDSVIEPPEKLLNFLRLCTRSRSMVPGVFTWRAKTGGSQTKFYVEGAVYQPRSDNTDPVLLLRWRPQQQVARRFIELTEKIDQLSKEMFFREKVAAERARLYEAEQLARQAAEEMALQVTSLQGITAALSKAITPAQVARAVIERSLPVLGAAGGVVTLLNGSQTELEVLYFEGYTNQSMEHWRPHFSTTLASPLTQSVLCGKPVFVTTLAELTEQYPALARQLTSTNQAWAALPLNLEDHPIGALGFSFAEPRHFSETQQEFLLTLANQCAQALERSRLYEVEQQARQEAEANQKRLALLAEMHERNRMAQELHDTVAQALGYLNLKIAVTASTLDGDDIDTVKANVQDLKQIVAEIYTDVREEIFNLRAKVTAGLNFMEVLERYIDKYQRFYNLRIQQVQEADLALFDFPADVTTQLVRTIQEALINIRKHAQVQTAIIRLGQENGGLYITIEDQGQGFDPEQVKEKTTSFGLQIMRERVESIGWNLEVATTPGRGTRIILRNQEANSAFSSTPSHGNENESKQPPR